MLMEKAVFQNMIKPQNIISTFKNIIAIFFVKEIYFFDFLRQLRQRNFFIKQHIA